MSDPATDARSVTPSDLVDLDPWADALYVGGAGNVTIVTIGGTEVTFVGVQAGSVIPIGARRVLTSTTATNIVALF